MIPSNQLPHHHWERIPRESGDDPTKDEHDYWIRQYSPRERG